MGSYSDYGRCLLDGKVSLISLIDTTPEEALRQEQKVQEFLRLEEARREEELEAGIIGFRRQFYRQDRIHWSPDDYDKQQSIVASLVVSERLIRTRNSIRRKLSRTSWITRKSKKANTSQLQEYAGARGSNNNSLFLTTRSMNFEY